MTKEKFLAGLVEHLSELRARLFKIAAVFAASFIASFFAVKPAMRFLKTAPMFQNLSWNAFSPFDGVSLFMKIALFISLSTAIPFAFYQLWKFVKPGLSEKEIRATFKYAPCSLLFLALGLSFSFFVLLPMAYKFAFGMTEDMGLQPVYGANQFLAFGLNLLIPMTIAFQMPLAVLFLTKIRLVDAKRLAKIRRPAYVVLYLVGAMLSPPDFISHFLVAVPLLILFEVSVLFSNFAAKAAKSLEPEPKNAL